MVTLKYTIDKDSLYENLDLDLTEFEEVTITFEESEGIVSPLFFNSKIMIGNKIVMLDKKNEVKPITT